MRASIITVLAGAVAAYVVRVPLSPNARAAAAMIAPVPADMETWELCLAEASVEEDVQECMSRMDDEREALELKQQESQRQLELCILSAENEDAVQACLQMFDEAD